jgi:hypothetical protein
MCDYLVTAVSHDNLAYVILVSALNPLSVTDSNSKVVALPLSSIVRENCLVYPSFTIFPFSGTSASLILVRPGGGVRNFSGVDSPTS